MNGALVPLSYTGLAEGTGLEIRRLSTGGAELKTKLQNGDIVRLLPIVPRFENAVTLRGTSPIRGAFHGERAYESAM